MYPLSMLSGFVEERYEKLRSYEVEEEEQGKIENLNGKEEMVIPIRVGDHLCIFTSMNLQKE